VCDYCLEEHKTQRRNPQKACDDCQLDRRDGLLPKTHIAFRKAWAVLFEELEKEYNQPPGLCGAAYNEAHLRMGSVKNWAAEQGRVATIPR
jgi:hypothetical protein